MHSTDFHKIYYKSMNTYYSHGVLSNLPTPEADTKTLGFTLAFSIASAKYLKDNNIQIAFLHILFIIKL